MAKSLTEETNDFVFDYLKQNLPDTYIYHNYTHTKRVFKSVKEIIENS